MAHRDVLIMTGWLRTLIAFHITYKKTTAVWGTIAVTLSDWGAGIIVTCVITNGKCSWECRSSLWHSRCAALQSAAALSVCQRDTKGGTQLICGCTAPPTGVYVPLGNIKNCYKKCKKIKLCLIKLFWNMWKMSNNGNTVIGQVICGVFSYPSPRARMCDSSSEGMKTLRNSAEKMPPFFMAPVFLMLSVTERRGWRKWNSLHKSHSL